MTFEPFSPESLRMAATLIASFLGGLLSRAVDVRKLAAKLTSVTRRVAHLEAFRERIEKNP